MINGKKHCCGYLTYWKKLHKGLLGGWSVEGVGFGGC
ncbi:hypothetical protein HmCmsJML041_01483 [Escherichia coli]|nr:hypothetical protein HmCmsJML041_01483 [Escherichia coli]